MQLPFGLDLVSFFAGVVFVLVLAFFAFLLNVWWRAATSPFRPQIVAQTTRKTPWQVVIGAFGAIFQYVGAAFLAGAVVLVLIFGVAPVEVATLAIVGLVTIVIGTLLRTIT